MGVINAVLYFFLSDLLLLNLCLQKCPTTILFQLLFLRLYHPQSRLVPHAVDRIIYASFSHFHPGTVNNIPQEYRLKQTQLQRVLKTIRHLFFHLSNLQRNLNLNLDAWVKASISETSLRDAPIQLTEIFRTHNIVTITRTKPHWTTDFWTIWVMNCQVLEILYIRHRPDADPSSALWMFSVQWYLTLEGLGRERCWTTPK